MSDIQPTNNPPLSYADSGVDIDAGNALINAIKPLIASTMRPGADGSIGGFGGVFDIAATGYKDPLLVAANDGVGTKLKIAIDTNQHSTIGQDLVAMCVNDLIVQGAEPLFFLDYFATGKLDNAIAQSVIASIAEGCRLAGCALAGGETAEMPGMYQVGDYDLAGFSVGAVERNDLLPQSVSQGDVLLGLLSSGPHSNGFSLIRKIVERSGLGWGDLAPFNNDLTVAEALLTPTKIYVKSVLQALKLPEAVHALAHITGGGLTENLPRVLPGGLTANINCAAWKPSPVFQWLKHVGSVVEGEMLRTFNCGIGMVVIVAADRVEQVQTSLEQSGETVIRIGQLEPGNEPVVFTGALDWS